MQERIEPVEAATRGVSERPAVLGLLDFCKGMAILWVMLVHATRGWFGWQGVHVFVVISGFTLTYARLTKGGGETWRGWWLRRAARILPTYWLIALTGFLLVLLLDRLVPAANNPATASDHLWRLAADLTFLRNLSYKTMLADPNSALWFIGLTISFYLAFPLLYAFISEHRHRRSLIIFLLCAVAAEFVYRALAIYALDGVPVGYGHGFLKFFGRVPRAADEVAQGFAFQLWAPFGIFISRVGEYALGMVAAVRLADDSGRFDRLLVNPWSALAGLAVWLGGNALLYTGRWGWVVADFVIAAGLIVWLVNLAEFARVRAARLFSGISWLGVWSYYLFLTHLLAGYAVARLYTWWAGSVFTVLLALLAAVASVVVACRLLRRIDRAGLGKNIFR